VHTDLARINRPRCHAGAPWVVSMFSVLAAGSEAVPCPSGRYGEVFASTVCSRMSWCRLHDLREPHAASYVSPEAEQYADSSTRSRKGLAHLVAEWTRDSSTLNGSELVHVRSKGSPKRPSHARLRPPTQGLGRWVHAVKDGCMLLALARCAANASRPCSLDTSRSRAHTSEK
jgi:hypothetical protein